MSYFSVQLDKSRNFKYGMRAISAIEKKLKKPLGKIDMESLTMEETAIFIWAGLIHEDTSLTPETVMDLIDIYSSLTTIMPAMSEAIQDSFGVKLEEKNE